MASADAPCLDGVSVPVTGLSNQMYECSGNTWKLVTSLAGSQGPQGDPGPAGPGISSYGGVTQLATIAVATNGFVISTSVVGVVVASGTVCGTTIVGLAAGDTLTLRNYSAIPITLTLAPSAGAQMSVTQIG